MPPSLTREEALRVLGVPLSADGRAVKQAYRRLVRQHHPDRGGDPGTFHRLQLAYERLVEEDAPRPPRVARGRPSRSTRGTAAERPRVDPATVAWDAPVDGDAGALDHDRLAVLLARDAPGPVAPVGATSRAPGARLNRVAANLSAAFTARLEIAPTTDDRGHTVVRAEVSASGRRARAALDRAVLDDAWTRTRRPTSTVLRTFVPPAEARRETALQVAGRVAEILTALRWPLGEWTVTDEGR